MSVICVKCAKAKRVQKLNLCYVLRKEYAPNETTVIKKVLSATLCRQSAVPASQVDLRCRFTYGPADATATHYLLLQ